MTPTRPSWILLLPALLLLPVGAAARDLPPVAAAAGGEDAAELARLQRIIRKQTDIATKTRMNADYVPGMVTVFLGEELAARGVTTVGEAIKLVDNLVPRLTIPASTNYQGQGITFKWMLNHAPIDTLSNSQIWVITHIPISQVARIEIVHGPGSQTQGHFAYAGLIHIVTRQTGAHLQGAAGSDSHAGASGHATWSNPSNTVSMSLGLTGWREGDEGRDSRLPFTAIQMARAGRVSAADSDPEKYRYGFFSLKIGETTRLTANHMALEDRISISAPSAGGDINRIVGGEQRKTNVALDHSVTLRPDLQAAFNFSHQSHRSGEEMLNPKLVAGNVNLAAGDLVRHHDLRERVTEAGVTLTLSRWPGHTVQAGLQAARNRIDWDARGVGGAVTPSTQKRLHWSVVLQDQIDLDGKTALTASLRYDHFDRGVGGHLSPRLALVRRVDAALTLKAQYTHTARPISRDEALEEHDHPETGDTLEVGATHRTEKNLGRMTVFHSWRRNLFGISPGVDDRAQITGLEAGGEHEFSPWLNLEGWLAWSNPRGDGIKHDGHSLWYGNIGANLVLQDDWRLNLRVDHQDEDTSRLSAGHATLTRDHFFHPDLALRLALRNLFAIENKDPAAPISEDSGFRLRLELSYRH